MLLFSSPTEAVASLPKDDKVDDVDPQRIGAQGSSAGISLKASDTGGAAAAFPSAVWSEYVASARLVIKRGSV